MRGATRILLALLLLAQAAHAAPSVLLAIGDTSPLGLPFSRFSEVALDDRGRAAFVGASTAVFARTGETLTHLVGAGDAVLGRTIAGVDGPALGAGGCLAFRALFVGGGAAIATRCGGSVRAVAQVGQPAPGGGDFAGFGSDVALSGGGWLAFSAVLDDGTTGVFVADPGGSVAEVTRTGALSPAGGAFTSLRVIGVGGAGTVAFRGSVSSGPDGLFSWDGNALGRIAVVGDASPAGGAFTSLGLGTMNDAGVCAFGADISSGPRAGIFRAVVSALTTLRPVALEGDATPIGGTFEAFATSLAVNAGGEVAFRATLRGLDVPSAGVFVAAAGGSLASVVAVGEPTAVGKLVRLREIALADDGSVLVGATLPDGAPALVRVRAGQVDRFAVLGDANDLGRGFRFADASARESADTGVFLGLQEGLFVVDGPGSVRRVAALDHPGARGGRYAELDPPAAGGDRVVFGANLAGGRSAEILFEAGRAGARALAHGGQRVGRKGRMVDLFGSSLDGLAQAGVAGSCVAFETSLSGVKGGSGIVALGGGRRIVAHVGQHAPGGGAYRAFGTPAVGAGCQVVFVALAGTSALPSLFRAGGGGSRRLAGGGDGTRTRVGGTFRSFDVPAVADGRVAFRAVLGPGREAVFFARGGCRMAMAGTGESEPGGGKFRSFSAPTFAGPDVVFRASVVGGAAPGAVYRAMPSGPCTQVPPLLATITAVGMPARPGTTYLGFGVPSGNRHGAVAFSADLTGAGPTDAIVLDQ